MWQDRITYDPRVMGGKPCIRKMRITVSTIMDLLAGGISRERILEGYPELVAEDLDAVMHYAAWKVKERIEEMIPS